MSLPPTHFKQAFKKACSEGEQGGPDDPVKVLVTKSGNLNLIPRTQVGRKRKLNFHWLYSDLHTHAVASAGEGTPSRITRYVCMHAHTWDTCKGSQIDKYGKNAF